MIKIFYGQFSNKDELYSKLLNFLDDNEIEYEME